MSPQEKFILTKFSLLKTKIPPILYYRIYSENTKMSRNTRKIPLTNDNREIMKCAVFSCCTFWKRIINANEINNGQTCDLCHRLVSPRIEEWSKRWFGSFKCTRTNCGRTWTSSWTWTVDNQIQTTQCLTCKTSVLPYQLVSSFHYKL